MISLLGKLRIYRWIRCPRSPGLSYFKIRELIFTVNSPFRFIEMEWMLPNSNYTNLPTQKLSQRWSNFELTYHKTSSTTVAAALANISLLFVHKLCPKYGMVLADQSPFQNDTGQDELIALLSFSWAWLLGRFFRPVFILHVLRVLDAVVMMTWSLGTASLKFWN